jgi:hypothetical protein
MRRVLAALATLLSTCACAPASQRIDGYLTVGCNDQYLQQPGNAETWFAGLSAQQRKEIIRLSGHGQSESAGWYTLHVVLLGVLHERSHRGFFGDHTRTIEVAQIVSARHLDLGESTNVAAAAQRYRGVVVAGPESYGFVPFARNDEMWRVVPGKTDWKTLYAPFPQNPWTLYNAVVEIVGRVGPPVQVDANTGAIREVAVDQFSYIRAATPSELKDTAAIDGVVASIEKCELSATDGGVRLR